MLRNSSDKSLNPYGLWFRRDLRLDDNPALHAAVGSASLLPIYVFDLAKFNVPTLAGARKSNARRARFLLESVACLRKRLQEKGSGLAVFVGKPEHVLSRLGLELSTLVVTRSASAEEVAEEEQIQTKLSKTELKRIWGGTLYAPEECGCQPMKAPLLFSSFRDGAERKGRIRKPLEVPQTVPSLPRFSGPIMQEEIQNALDFFPCLSDLGYSREEVDRAYEDDLRGVLPFEGGEIAGLQRIQQWIFRDDRLKDYFRSRNGMLGEGYSSKFSPWLALGCISPRRIWHEVQRYESERIRNKSTYWLVFELIWRDFFFFMGLSHGKKLFQLGGIIGDRTPWHGSQSSLEKWKEGNTGDSLVDANMRELKATGFMSNRGRQNVASYLIFDLEVDWRYGAAHFEEFLLDHDACSNWGNWVAAAGLTGQRINRFNTKKQLSDYDPGHEYVDCWLLRVPEIKKRKRTDLEKDRPIRATRGPSDSLNHGMKVRLMHLEQASQMNGATGVLGKFCEQRGCWQVFLDSSGKAKAIKPCNLEPIMLDKLMGA